MTEPTTTAQHKWHVPHYADLPRIDALGARHGWDVFGAGDQLGRINLLTTEVVAAAAAEVRSGRIFNLSLPLDEPEPSWSHFRPRLEHHIFSVARNTQDDYVDAFYMQRSTQWDGLRHHQAREFGLFGGVPADEAGADGTKLGIELWAQHGIAGRGVLVDVGRHVRLGGAPFDPRVPTPITAPMLRETLDAEGVELRVGDILMVRTGYVDAYLNGSAEVRADMATGNRDTAGLHAGEEMAEFLWDSGAAAVVTDNPAVEVVPGDPAVGSLHRRLIPLLGFAIGELFDFSVLSADCAADGVYTCMFVGVPLNLPGGVGSPGNAIAIK